MLSPEVNRSEPASPKRPVVADAVLSEVKLSDPSATVAELRSLFEDAHVHAAVLVRDGLLLSVVDRDDLEHAPSPGAAAIEVGAVNGRVISPDADLIEARDLMIASGRRRLAVVGPDGYFRGLLCLKRSRSGFCSNQDVRARSDEAARRPRG